MHAPLDAELARTRDRLHRIIRESDAALVSLRRRQRLARGLLRAG